jgi:cobalt-zinc-cadmium resistance protein CzcA
LYINQSKLAEANIKSSELQMKMSQLEVSTQVKQVYYQLSYLHTKQKLLSYQDSLYSGFFRAAELKAKTGETNRLEMITARSQSMEVKNQIHQVVADISIYYKKLQTLLNEDHKLSISDTILQRAAFYSVADSLVLNGNPSAGYMKQQITISGIERKLETSRMMPEFNIGYFSQTMQGVQEVNGIPRTFGPGDRLSGIQASISIPIWMMPYASKAKAAKLKQQVAQTDSEYYVKSLSGNYTSLLEEYSKYSKSLEYYEKEAVPEADLIIEYSGKSYKAGAMGYQDYVQSLGRALIIKQNYLDALNDYNQTIISIDFITGKTF